MARKRKKNWLKIIGLPAAIVASLSALALMGGKLNAAWNADKTEQELRDVKYLTQQNATLIQMLHQKKSKWKLF